MGKVIVRLFGMRGGDSVVHRMERPLEKDTTVGQLLEQLQAEAHPNTRLSTVRREALLVLINGRPIDYLDGWASKVADQDEVTFMLKVAGG